MISLICMNTNTSVHGHTAQDLIAHDPSSAQNGHMTIQMISLICMNTYICAWTGNMNIRIISLICMNTYICAWAHSTGPHSTGSIVSPEWTRFIQVHLVLLEEK